jgi:hypothetical protein
MIESIYLGKPLSKYTKKELIQIINDMENENNRTREQYQKESVYNFLDEIRTAKIKYVLEKL